ncbi:MAG: type IV pilus modification PilV family protein [Gemmatimonadaceae bacterium]
MRPDRVRRGSALVEVLIAMVVLATVGTGLITLLGQTAHSMRTSLVSERLVRAASAELDRLAVLDEAALASRAGRSHPRGFTLDIRPLGDGLFDVSIAESDTTRELLRSTLYRPAQDSSNVAP